MVDAFTFLRSDHESVLGMFEVLDGAPQGKGAQLSGLRTMVTDLVVAESRHEAIEQQFFWPLVRERPEDGDRLADDAMAQENSGRHLLQKLENGNPGSPNITVRRPPSSKRAATTSRTNRTLSGRAWPPH